MEHTPNIGLNLICNSDCTEWCPRIIKCCKKKQESDSESSSDYEIDRDYETRVYEIAKEALELPDTPKPQRKGITY